MHDISFKADEDSDSLAFVYVRKKTFRKKEYFRACDSEGQMIQQL